MILECGSCAKMYRVRDDASPQPTKCPTCSGPLHAAGGGAAAPSSSKVRELETKIQLLERELAESRTGRPTLSVETSPGMSGFSAPVAELRAAAEKADRLERELLSFRSEMERKLKEKDLELSRTRESQDREAAERRKQEARANGLEETHGRALEGKEKTIQALDASIASYRTKVDGLQKKLDAVEIQRLSDLNAFDTRLREREQADRDQLDRTSQSQQQALAALREETEGKIAEKDRQISEGRQALDREAGERRRLSETLSRLQENADRTIAEKDTAIAAIQATLDSYKTKIDTLQRRIDSLEQMRRSEQDLLTAQLRASQTIRIRVDDAGHLATDLDHSLDSIEASIATLRDRTRRLRETLRETGSEAEAAAPPASVVSSFAPAADPEPEAPAPSLSQAESWGAPAGASDNTPELAEPETAEPGLSPAALAPPGERPAFSEVTPTQVARRPEPDLEEAPRQAEGEAAAVPIEPEGPEARVLAPSGILPAVPSAPPAAPSSTSALEETADDIPLISPPEEDRAPVAAPPAKKEETRRKFSWQKK